LIEVSKEDRNMTDNLDPEDNIAFDRAGAKEGERISSTFSMAHGTPVTAAGLRRAAAAA
jgi:hypothetical protein